MDISINQTGVYFALLHAHVYVCWVPFLLLVPLVLVTQEDPVNSITKNWAPTVTTNQMIWDTECQNTDVFFLKARNEKVAIHLPLGGSHGIPDIYHISHRQADALFGRWQRVTRGTMSSSVSFLRKDAYSRVGQWKKPISVHSKCRALMCLHVTRGVGGDW